MSSKTKTIIHWFRKGLRIHDNPALIDAIDRARTKKYYLRPIFIVDPSILTWMTVGANRWRFLQQSLVDLDIQLRSIGTRLYVVRGTPNDVFHRLFNEWNVTLLTFEADIEPYAKDRDAKIENMARNLNVEVIQRVSHTIYDPNTILAKNLGRPPLTYQKFLSVAESVGKVRDPVPAPETIPDCCSPCMDSEELQNADCYNPPTLAELGVKEEELGENKYPGGETEALKRLERYMAKKNWVCTFEKPNTAPNSLEPSTTVLSPYVKFGCLSSRLFYHRVKQVTAGTSKHTKPPVSLIGQLMWREFYYTVGAATANFDRMLGNAVCCQVPWDSNVEYLEAWQFGRTGYPFIDAVMRQLKQEGWIHHLARHAVACFLTRGDLWQSWEAGQKVFEEYLLDADWALNAGNWLWLSASAFFHQFYRVYSPVAFGKKTDKNGDYIRKYVPEVSKFPPEYIYEPWRASLAMQKTAGCIIGRDYPKRIVIHEDVYKKNITKMSLAYKENKMKNAAECSTGKKRGNSGNSSKKGNGKQSKTQSSITKFLKKDTDVDYC